MAEKMMQQYREHVHLQQSIRHSLELFESELGFENPQHLRASFTRLLLLVSPTGQQPPVKVLINWLEKVDFYAPDVPIELVPVPDNISEKCRNALTHFNSALQRCSDLHKKLCAILPVVRDEENSLARSYMQHSSGGMMIVQAMQPIPRNLEVIREQIEEFWSAIGNAERSLEGGEITDMQSDKRVNICLPVNS